MIACSRVSVLSLAWLLSSPEYFAVMAWVPTVNDVVLSVADPFVIPVGEPSAVPPS